MTEIGPSPATVPISAPSIDDELQKQLPDPQQVSLHRAGPAMDTDSCLGPPPLRSHGFPQLQSARIPGDRRDHIPRTLAKCGPGSCGLRCEASGHYRRPDQKAIDSGGRGPGNLGVLLRKGQRRSSMKDE